MYKINLSKLRDHGVDNDAFYKWQLSNKLNPKDPIVVKFTDKKKQLIYVAVNHTADPKSLTFKMIDKYIKNVDLVLIEGVDYALGISPELEYYNEGQYIIDKCKERNIGYRGMEGSRKKMTESLIKLGYNKKDIMLWIILSNYKVFARDKHTEKEFRDDIKSLIKYLKTILSVSSFDFDKEFTKRIGEKFVYNKQT